MEEGRATRGFSRNGLSTPPWGEGRGSSWREGREHGEASRSSACIWCVGMGGALAFREEGGGGACEGGEGGEGEGMCTAAMGGEGAREEGGGVLGCGLARVALAE